MDCVVNRNLIGNEEGLYEYANPLKTCQNKTWYFVLWVNEPRKTKIMGFMMLETEVDEVFRRSSSESGVTLKNVGCAHKALKVKWNVRYNR